MPLMSMVRSTRYHKQNDYCNINFGIEVTGVHFIYLAKLLLATHDPTIPRIGSRVKLATAKMQVSTSKSARKTSNRDLTNDNRRLHYPTYEHFVALPCATPSPLPDLPQPLVSLSVSWYISIDFTAPLFVNDPLLIQIYTGGSWFKRRPEQEALIAFMSRTEKCSGWIWPSQQPQQTLMEDWGWE